MTLEDNLGNQFPPSTIMDPTQGHQACHQVTLPNEPPCQPAFSCFYFSNLSVSCAEHIQFIVWDMGMSRSCLKSLLFLHILGCISQLSIPRTKSWGPSREKKERFALAQLQAFQAWLFGPVVLAPAVRQIMAGGTWWGRLVNREKEGEEVLRSQYPPLTISLSTNCPSPATMQVPNITQETYMKYNAAGQ